MIRVLSIVHYPSFGGPHNRNAKVAPYLENHGVRTTVLLPTDLGNAAERLRNSGVAVETIPLARIRAKFNPFYRLPRFAIPLIIFNTNKASVEKNIGKLLFLECP